MKFEKPSSQKKFICLRTNQYARAGWWFIAEEVGELLYRCVLRSGPRGSILEQVSQTGIPFPCLAPYIVELGFEIPQSMVNQRPSLQHEVDEVEAFQREVEEIVEPEFLEKKKKEFPSYATKGGIIVPGEVKNEEGTK